MPGASLFCTGTYTILPPYQEISNSSIPGPQGALRETYYTSFLLTMLHISHGGKLSRIYLYILVKEAHKDNTYYSQIHWGRMVGIRRVLMPVEFSCNRSNRLMHLRMHKRFSRFIGVYIRRRWHLLMSILKVLRYFRRPK